jgi:hypothetical protein
MLIPFGKCFQIASLGEKHSRKPVLPKLRSMPITKGRNLSLDIPLTEQVESGSPQKTFAPLVGREGKAEAKSQ